MNWHSVWVDLIRWIHILPQHLKGKPDDGGWRIGIQKTGIFIDLTYVESILNDVNFPYRLGDKDNVYSTVKQYTGNLLLTFGIKF